MKCFFIATCALLGVWAQSVAAQGTGAVYTRWGRTTCPSNSFLVYEGLAAGAHYYHKGSGANYLCLPTNPQSGPQLKGATACSARVYGAEYQLCSPVKGVFGTENGNNFNDQDVPCAVCQAAERQISLFVPARTECPTGWNKEYRGFVMSSYYQYGRTEFVCVDASPETRSNGQANLDGALFYFATTACPSNIPCPPYQNEAVIPCVVCTK